MNIVSPIRMRKTGGRARFAFGLSVACAVSLVVIGWIFVVSSQLTQQFKDMTSNISTSAKQVQSRVDRVRTRTQTPAVTAPEQISQEEQAILDYLKLYIEEEQAKPYAEEERSTTTR